MIPDYEYEVSSILYFIPTEEINSKGNPKSIPVVVRKMILTCRHESSSFNPPKIKLTRFTRGEETKYCFSGLVYAPPPMWPTPGQVKIPPKWKKIASYQEGEALDYLSKLIGATRAPEAMHELINKIPVKYRDVDLPEDEFELA